MRSAQRLAITAALLAAAIPVCAATILSAASYDAALAPGSIAVVFGSNFSTETALAGAAWPTELAGVTVTFNGTAARIQFVSPGQMNILVPPQLAEGEATVVIRNRSGVQATERVTVRLCAPGVFALDAQGRGAIVNGVTAALDPFSAATPENPGPDKRTVLSIYGTGIRYAGNAARDDARNVAAEVRVQAFHRDGRSWILPVAYAGAAPGFTGLDQVNVSVPDEIENAGEVRLVVFAAGMASKPVNAIFASQAAHILTQVTPAASPGALFTITGTGFPNESPLDNRPRLTVTVRAGDLEARAWVTESRPEAITAVMPAIGAAAGWYQGPAEVCVAVGSARQCLNQGIDISAAAAPAQEAGATLLGLARAARDGANSSAAQTHAAVLEARLNALIQDALAGRSQSRAFPMPDGSRQTVVFDAGTLRRVESLAAAQPAPVLGNLPAVDAGCPYPEERSKLEAKAAYGRLEAGGWAYFAAAAAAAVTGAAASCAAGASACPVGLAAALLALEAGWLPSGWPMFAGQIDIQRIGSNLLLRLPDPDSLRMAPGAVQDINLHGSFGNLSLKDASGQPLESALTALPSGFAARPFGRLAASGGSAHERAFLLFLQQYAGQKFNEEWRSGLVELTRGAAAGIAPTSVTLSARSLELAAAGPVRLELACADGLVRSRITGPAGSPGTAQVAFIPRSSLLWRDDARELMGRLRVEYGVRPVTGGVRGVVRNGSNGRAINGARVEILSLNLNTATGPTGEFQLTGIPAGQHTLRAGATGFVSAEAGLQVEPGQTAARDFSLAPTSPAEGTLVTGPHNIQFVSITPGEFSMGCSPDDFDCAANETPWHLVRISKAFDIGRYEVTQAQWESVMGSSPSRFPNPNNPVERVTWDEVQIFFERLNALNDGYFYRLPTEAEWEYAARAGSTTARYGLLDDVAWHQGNSAARTHPVGQKQPNAWGLYDMLGNVAERVRDWLGIYPPALTFDPAGPASGQQRVERGGHWNGAAPIARATNRAAAADWTSGFDHLGFRCVRERIRAIPEGLHTLQFTSVVAGQFTRGCSAGDSECTANERPAHQVRITKPFEIGKHEVTQLQWDWVMGSNPSQFQRPDRPVENVTWHEIQIFMDRLNARNDGYRYRLPTEAEWEYAARAGTTGARYGPIDEIAWYGANSGGVTHPPGEKRPNTFDVFDALGGVWEWVQDSYGDYASGTQVDPKGPASGAFPVVRGGAWDSPASQVRASARESRDPGLRFNNTGFRCVREELPGSRVPELHSLTLAALSIPSGGSTRGTVRLTFPAKAGGLSVALSSSNPAAAAVPVDVTVPAGLTSAFFTVTGRAVTSQQTVTITAKLGSITKTAPLTVNAPVVLFRMDFVTIQPGEFNMGCSPGDGACDNDETPVRPVRITRAFDMGKYEVQQQQWEGVMGSNPSFFRGADRPVEQVSWLEIQNFLQRMNARGDGYRYRLPTEAEWEYAARAGSTGATYGSLNNIAWHSENSGGQTHPSGMKDPNAWGLYDIYGNAWEFVADWYGPYAAGAAVDPKGGGDTGAKVMRGGSWTFEAGSYRASDRSRFPTDEKASFVGFRLVRERL